MLTKDKELHYIKAGYTHILSYKKWSNFFKEYVPCYFPVHSSALDSYIKNLGEGHFIEINIKELT